MKTTPLSILFLGTQMEVAGAQRLLLAQARWFHRQGYRVQVVFFYDKQGLQTEWQKEHPFPVISLGGWNANTALPLNLPKLIRALFALFKLLKKDVQVVVTYTPHSNLLGLPLAWLAHVPVRLGTHHGHILGFPGWLAHLHGRLTNSRLCSMMVTVSAQVRDYALNKEGAKASKLAVIQNGIEPPAPSSLSKREALRGELKLTEGDLLLLTVGRLTLQKGHTILLEAIAKLAPRFPQARFSFVGDGPQRASLEEQAAHLGIMERVFFLGVRNDVAELLNATDIFVQPSLSEGLPLALLEALFAGLPVVATRVGGVAEVVEDGRSALLVAPGDARALAEAVSRMLEDTSLRERLALAGQARARASYDIDTMCKAYEMLMQRLSHDA